MNVNFNNRVTSIFISFMITISSVVCFSRNIIAETSLEMSEFQNKEDTTNSGGKITSNVSLKNILAM